MGISESDWLDPKRGSAIALLILIAMGTLFGSGNYQATVVTAQSSAQLTVNVERSSYLPGEIVRITGTAPPNTYVSVEVRNPLGTIVFIGTPQSASSGQYATKFRLPVNSVIGNYSISASIQGSIKAATFSVPVEKKLTIRTDQTSYSLGDLVSMSGEAPSDSIVSLEVRNPLGTLIFVSTPKPTSDGIFTSRFRLPSDAPPGTYSVFASIEGKTAATSFSVVALATVSLTIDPQKPYYREERVTVTVVASVELRSINVYVTQSGDAVRQVPMEKTTGSPFKWTGSYFVAKGFDGIATATANGEDVNGNKLSASESFNVDTIPPSASAEVTPSQPSIQETPFFTVVTNDAGSDIANVELYIDNSLVQKWTSAGEHTFSTGPFPEGRHSFYVVAIDNAGNSARVDSEFVVPPQKKESLITLTAAPADGSIVLRGQIAPDHSNFSVDVFFRERGLTQWNRLASVQTSSDGSFSFTMRPQRPLTYEFFAQWEGHLDHFGAQSPVTSATPTFADIVVTDLSWNPTQPAERDRISFTFAILNNGDARANEFTSTLLLDGRVVDTSVRFGLDSGESRVASFSFQWSGTAGSHSVVVIGDFNQEVPDSDRSNNALSATFTVRQLETVSRTIYVYAESQSGILLAEYLKSQPLPTPWVFTDQPSTAFRILSIGAPLENSLTSNVNEVSLKPPYGFGWDPTTGKIKVGSIISGKSYSGLLGVVQPQDTVGLNIDLRFKGKPIIVAFGNDLSGTITAVRAFLANAPRYLTATGVDYVESFPVRDFLDKNGVSRESIISIASIDSTDVDLDELQDSAENALGTNPLMWDSEKDGMPDGWEVAHGLNPLDPTDAARSDAGDGITNLEKYRFGGDPRTRDLFVQVDYMPGRNIIDQLENIVANFRQNGITLHLFLGNELPRKPETSFDDLRLWRNTHLALDRRGIFHYAVIAEKSSEPYGGLADGIPGESFIVWTINYLGIQNSVEANSHIFMHELGHTIGLWHSGDQCVYLTFLGERVVESCRAWSELQANGFLRAEPFGLNKKTNYVSIMNYRYGYKILDYSHGENPPIDENIVGEQGDSWSSYRDVHFDFDDWSNLILKPHVGGWYP